MTAIFRIASLLALPILLGAACKTENSQPSSAAPSPTSAQVADGGQVVAELGDLRLTEAELAEKIRPQMAKIEAEIYETKRDAIDDWVNISLLEKEAKRQGTSVESLLDQKTTGIEVSDAEAEAFYNANKGRIKGDFAQVKSRVVAQLSGQKRQEITRSFLAELEKQTPAKIYISQPRIDVSADDDPAIGDTDAKITLIEFSDFQCPFCKRARPVIDQILSTYGKKVRYVFRDFPLAFHRDSPLAHEAANCAGDQGQYWEYNRKLWENQQDLKREQLLANAKALKLKEADFVQCLDSHKYTAEVQKDIADGRKAGVSGTPAYFVNGRMLSGAQPFEAFAKIIDDELSK